MRCSKELAMLQWTVSRRSRCTGRQVRGRLMWAGGGGSRALGARVGRLQELSALGGGDGGNPVPVALQDPRTYMIILHP